jgi:hypothetical protein
MSSFKSVLDAVASPFGTRASGHPPSLARGKGKLGFRVGIPAVAYPEPPQSLGSRGPLDQQVRMFGINLHRNLQEVKRPNRSGRASILNGQLPLDRAAYAT